MLVELPLIEKELPTLLRDGERWQSLLIDYHPPVVERLWREYKGLRINLHRIYPCDWDEALFHPHPWPSTVRVFPGARYEMGIGYNAGNGNIVAARICVENGFVYDMTERTGLHYVRPIDGPSDSLMITGQPYDDQSLVEKVDKPLVPLSDKQYGVILASFQQRYRLL